MRLAALLLAATLLTVLPPAEADPCPTKSWTSGTDPQHSVAVSGDCSVELETNRGIICVGAWTATDEYQIGTVHWVNHRCAFPGGSPLDPPVMSLGANCAPKTIYAGAAIVETFSDCSTRVSIDVIDCLWGEEWVTYQAGPATVRYTRCTGPPPA